MSFNPLEIIVVMLLSGLALGVVIMIVTTAIISAFKLVDRYL